MNIQTEKLQIIDWIIALQDNTTIEKIKFLKDNPGINKDWRDCISETEKQGIDAGLLDIKNGKTIPHKKVKKQYNKWL